MRDSFFGEVILPTLGFITLIVGGVFLIGGFCEFVGVACETHKNSEKTLIISEDISKRVTNIESMLGIDHVGDINEKVVE